MKEIVKFRRAAKPEACPKRYVEDFAAKYDFTRTSSLTGCSAVYDFCNWLKGTGGTGHGKIVVNRKTQVES
jgi:hypothetical protein